MSKEVLLMVLGFAVFLAPFLGVPTVWRDTLLFLCGVFIVCLACALWIARRRHARKHTDSFREEVHS